MVARKNLGNKDEKSELMGPQIEPWPMAKTDDKYSISPGR